jgi:hypothetical protein
MIILFLVFALLSLLCLADTLGIVVRRVGFVINEPLAGYSVQSALSIGLRLINICFMPLFALSLDLNIFLSHFRLMAPLFILVPFLQFLTFIHLDSLGSIYSPVLLKMKKTGSFSFLLTLDLIGYVYVLIKRSLKPLLFGSLNPANVYYLTKSINNFYASQSSVSGALRSALPAYVLFYACWPLIGIGGALFPSNTALVLSLSSFLNGWSTIVSSISVDPALLALESDYESSSAAYADFVLMRFLASLFAWIAVSIFTILIPFII